MRAKFTPTAPSHSPHSRISMSRSELRDLLRAAWYEGSDKTDINVFMRAVDIGLANSPVGEVRIADDDALIDIISKLSLR